MDVASPSVFVLADPRQAEETKASAARYWLDTSVARAPVEAEDFDRAGVLDGLALWGIRVVHVGGGRVLCHFKVPRYQTDECGNWQPGAVASLMDDIGAMAIVSAIGEVKISVEFVISYFSQAKVAEEVEVEGRVVHDEGRMTAVVVDIWKKGSRLPVASGRQWMASVPKRIQSSL